MTTDLRPWCLRDLPDGRLCEDYEGHDGDCWAAPVEISVTEAPLPVAKREPEIEPD